ncbi:hypothetical protein ACOMHN_025568 [Nucella lapillus]
MPVSPLAFRAVCGGFLPVYMTFMLKRAKFKAAMFLRVLTLRNRRDGVVTGVILFLLYWGDLIHQCGDVELNPGPPKPDSFKQTTLRSGTQRQASTERAGESREDFSINDLVAMLSDMKESMNAQFKEPAIYNDFAVLQLEGIEPLGSLLTLGSSHKQDMCSLNLDTMM